MRSPRRLVVGLVAAVTVWTAARCSSDGEAVTEPVEPRSLPQPRLQPRMVILRSSMIPIQRRRTHRRPRSRLRLRLRRLVAASRQPPSIQARRISPYARSTSSAGSRSSAISGLRAAEVTVEDGWHENGAFGDPEYFRFAVHDVNFGDVTGDDVDDVILVVPFST